MTVKSIKRCLPALFQRMREAGVNHIGGCISKGVLHTFETADFSTDVGDGQEVPERRFHLEIIFAGDDFLVVIMTKKTSEDESILCDRGFCVSGEISEEGLFDFFVGLMTTEDFPAAACHNRGRMHVNELPLTALVTYPTQLLQDWVKRRAHI